MLSHTTSLCLLYYFTQLHPRILHRNPHNNNKYSSHGNHPQLSNALVSAWDKPRGPSRWVSFLLDKVQHRTLEIIDACRACSANEAEMHKVEMNRGSNDKMLVNIWREREEHCTFWTTVYIRNSIILIWPKEKAEIARHRSNWYDLLKSYWSCAVTSEQGD